MDGALNSAAAESRHDVTPRGTSTSGSFVIPCFREQETVQRTIKDLDALARRRPQVTWEIIVVDDGSDDETSLRAATAAAEIRTPVKLLRHRRNAGLGAGMRTGFAASGGDVVVAVDCDLSYGIGYIERLIDTWLESRPHIVIASPYMEGGHTERVPRALEIRSRAANWFLSWWSYDDIKTLTGMVRAYDGPFIRSMPLKAEGPDIMVEIVYKAQVLRARIEEIPATLSWAGLETRVSRSTLTSTRSRRTTYRQLINGYLWRPFWVPLIPGLLCGVVAVVLMALGTLGWQGLAIVCSVLAVALPLLALMSLQNKRYFEELFNSGFGLRRVGGIEPIRTPTMQLRVCQAKDVVEPGVKESSTPLSEPLALRADKATRPPT